MAALPALAGKGFGRREALLLGLLALAAVLGALRFEAAVHPERIHDPRPAAAFAADCAALPALRAVRVRHEGPLATLEAFGRCAALRPDVVGPFRRARYLRASPAEVLEAARALERGEAPTPPPMADLARYFRDARGPYRCDLLLAEGRTPSDVRARAPGAELSGEPVAREAEAREAKSIARALILGLTALAAWLAWRRGRLEAERRLLACLATLLALGLLGVGVDRWSVAALLLVAGAPRGAPLLAAAPCLLFPALALQRMGLVLCLGGALRLLMRRPALTRPLERRRAMRAAAVAVAGGVAAFLLLRAAPLFAVPRPEVAAEPSALLLPPDDVAEAAQRLRGAGVQVVGDEPLLPATPDPATRRNLWKVFSRSRALAARSEGEMRARFEDVYDASAQLSLTTLPRDLRHRLEARDGRAVLWAETDRPEFTSARLYRVRGEAALRSDARLAGVFVAVAWALAFAVARGAARPLTLRLLAAAAGGALLFVAAPAEADFYAPLLPLAAAAPALGTALALGAGGLLLPALLWPAAALLVVAALCHALIRTHPPRS